VVQSRPPLQLIVIEQFYRPDTSIFRNHVANYPAYTRHKATARFFINRRPVAIVKCRLKIRREIGVDDGRPLIDFSNISSSMGDNMRSYAFPFHFQRRKFDVGQQSLCDLGGSVAFSGRGSNDGQVATPLRCMASSLSTVPIGVGFLIFPGVDRFESSIPRSLFGHHQQSIFVQPPPKESATFDKVGQMRTRIDQRSRTTLITNRYREYVIGWQVSLR